VGSKAAPFTRAPPQTIKNRSQTTSFAGMSWRSVGETLVSHRMHAARLFAATYATSNLAKGVHTLSAVFKGDNFDSVASSATILVVQDAITH
jgi:hypothetical protein